MHHLDLILTLTGGLAAALALGLLSHKLKLSPIVGYLLAGILVGPYTPGFTAHKELAKEMAEIGVILLMFGVGLHFHFKELLAVKRIAVPGAIVQSAAATLLSMLIMHYAFGWSWAEGAVFGMAIAVASTVVLTRVLVDHKHLHTPIGHIAIGWLVVEDLFTVFILVLIPALFGGGGAGGGSLAVALGWTALKIAALVAFTFLVGGRIIPRLLEMIARTRSRELFTLGVLVIALGIAVGASKLFGVSMELGAFLAGMVVGRSDFSTRAATDALPMKDAFGVLFFVSVGMLFDLNSLLASPWLAAATFGIVVIGKPLAAIAISLLLGYPLKTSLAVGAVLSQIGEFSFIVGTLGKQVGLISETAFNALVATAILSITLSPLLYRSVGPLERWLTRHPALRARLQRQSVGEKAEVDRHPGLERRAVIVGHGPVGRTIGHLLRDNGIEPVFIEMNLETVQTLRRGHRPAVYGDASHPETLHAAGIEHAAILVVSASSVEAGREIIREAKALNPKLRVLVRTAYLREARELRHAGADGIFAGEGEVALAMTAAILESFSATPEQIERERERIRRELFEVC
jgi:CPA2 family monovalent cation:H+ antiporter-2